MTENDFVIQTSALTRRFGGRTAVDRLDMQVRRQEIFGLIGPDGAGKTTTLRMLCGAMEPTVGSATVAGFDTRKQIEQVRRRLGYMPQAFSLYPDLSVRENLEFFADLYDVPGKQRKERMNYLLEFSRLTDF